MTDVKYDGYQGFLSKDRKQIDVETDSSTEIMVEKNGTEGDTFIQ